MTEDCTPAPGSQPSSPRIEGDAEGVEVYEQGLRPDRVRLFRRREQKYEVGPASAAFLREEIGRRLPLFEFEPGHPTTYITTLYYDTQEREFYQRAERSYDDNVKIRVKEYYYPLPAGGQRSAVKSSPYCYVELKQSISGLVVKKRFGFPKRDLPLLLSGQDVWPILVKMTAATEVRSLEEVYKELSRYLRAYSIGLTSVVNYRRVVFQESEESLRITFDDKLSVYAPPARLYDLHEALTAEVLGTPIRRSDKVILEIKCPGEYPDWLQRAMQHHSKRRLSKFTTSVRMLIAKGGKNGGPEEYAVGEAHAGLPRGPNGDHPDAPPPFGTRHAASRETEAPDADTEQESEFLS